MSATIFAHLSQQLEELSNDGLLKSERVLVSSQAESIHVDGKDTSLINLCANNYLGLANDAELVAAAKSGMDNYGYGLASVRFICGTQDIHRMLETEIASFLKKDDAILFAACFDANGALFEPLLGEQDGVVSDSLNHASIIDGIRLCKARRYRYANNDMDALRSQLQQARHDGARFLMIATDGVFSMDGTYAHLPEICALAEEFNALVMVDDCHATGFIGEGGKGTPWCFAEIQKVDILTGTLGKALGGGLGGYIAGPQVVIDILRQRARPYLFSNSLPPAIVSASLAALRRVARADDLRQKLRENTNYWRRGLTDAGFNIPQSTHPIVPVMTGDASVATKLQNGLFDAGVLATAFSFPVVPKAKARVRTQINASLTVAQLDDGLAAFEAAGKQAGLI